MCTLLLPPGGTPIAVNKYIISSIAEVKNEWSYNSAPLIRLHGVDKVKFISVQCLL